MKALQRAIAATTLLLLAASCGRQLPSPLQSPIATSTPSPTPTGTPLASPSPSSSPTPTVVTSATPNIGATNTATAATVTAQAATPTRLPTQTPVPSRQVRGAGPGDPVGPTAAPVVISSTGVRVLSASSQVIRGGPASVTLQARAGATCALTTLRGAGGAESAQAIAGVPPRQTASDGGVAWIWTISADEPLGALRLRADCGDAGNAVFEIRVEP